MSKAIYLHIRTRTTIGMASEILRLALIRSSYLSSRFICTRIGIPEFIKDKRYPNLIYSYISSAPDIMQGVGFWFRIELLKSLIDQLIEFVAIRLPLFSRISRRIPQGQEGLFLYHPDHLSEFNRHTLKCKNIKKLARAVRNFGPIFWEDNPNFDHKSMLSALGINSDDWFVCLHVRTSYFHRDKTDFRNASFNNYYLVINYLVSLGAKVIRLGDPDLSINSYSRNGFIDYPNTPFKSEAMDLFLIKNCNFFIGVSSGILDTAFLLKTPTLCVNAIHFDLRSANPLDRMLYKHVVDIKTNKMLSIQECIDSFDLILHQNWQSNFRFTENTELELLDATIEFLENLRSPQSPSQRQVAVRRKIIRKRLQHSAKNGEIPSFFAASIAFSRCQLSDSQLGEYT